MGMKYGIQHSAPGLKPLIVFTERRFEVNWPSAVGRDWGKRCLILTH